jgi:hypothetical protein
MAMLDDATVKHLQRHWEDGWNAYDLARIMAPMDEDVVFSSPFVPRLTGDPAKTTIDGYAALRSYIEDSLRRVPDIRYTLNATYVGTDSLVLAYTFRLPDGTERTGADSMRVGADGKVVEWRCHYPFAADEVSQFIKA